MIAEASHSVTHDTSQPHMLLRVICAVTAEWVGGSPHPYCSVPVTNAEARVLKWVMTNVEILNIHGSQMLRLYHIRTAMYVGRPADRQQCVMW